MFPPLQIFTMTTSVQVLPSHLSINMSNLYTALDVDERIKGIKFSWKDTNYVRGSYSTSTVKKSKSADSSKLNKTSFYNQMSLVVSLDTHDVNVKLFQNGKLQITGCKTVMDPIDAGNIVIDRLNRLSKVQLPFLGSVNSDGILVDAHNNVYSHKQGHPIIGHLNPKTKEYNIFSKQCTFDAKDKVFVTTKQYGCRTNLLFNRDGDHVGEQCIELLKGKKKLYTKNGNIQIIDGHVYCNDSLIIGHVKRSVTASGLSQSARISEMCIQDTRSASCLMDMESKELVTPLLEYLSHDSQVDVYSIMAKTSLGFNINQHKLASLLSNRSFIVKYNPERYSGLYVLFKYNTLPGAQVTGVCGCHVKCTCDNLSVIFFQSGNVICSGFKSEHQLDEVWGILNGIIADKDHLYRKIDFSSLDIEKSIYTILNEK
jgi:TATA-box binding protein (TBP) (component of TFIID and TFIIIB)